MSIDSLQRVADPPPSSARRIVSASMYVGAGVVLILHGAAHAALAYRGSALLSELGVRALFGGACAIAMVGFILTGIGLATARPPERIWRGRAVAMLAVVASVVAFVMAWIPQFWPGLLLDGVIAAALFSSSGSASRTAQQDRRVLRRVSTITQHG